MTNHSVSRFINFVNYRFSTHFELYFTYSSNNTHAAYFFCYRAIFVYVSCVVHLASFLWPKHTGLSLIRHQMHSWVFVFIIIIYCIWVYLQKKMLFFVLLVSCHCFFVFLSIYRYNLLNHVLFVDTLNIIMFRREKKRVEKVKFARLNELRIISHNSLCVALTLKLLHKNCFLGSRK